MSTDAGVTIGVSSAGGILFVATVFAILRRRWKSSVQKRLRKRYFRKNKGILLEQLISSDQSAGDGTKIFSLEELEKATNSFAADRVLSRGGHGIVYKGVLEDKTVVAIKRSKMMEDAQTKEFAREMLILSQINHRNVVKLLGCCLEVEVPMLVYEFVSNDTLYHYIHDKDLKADITLDTLPRRRSSMETSRRPTFCSTTSSPQKFRISGRRNWRPMMRPRLRHWCRGLVGTLTLSTL